MARMREFGSTPSRFDLEESFATLGCGVCSLLESRLDRHLEAINYEAVNDPGFREEFLAGGGFCNPHAYRWLHQAFVLGTASLYRELLVAAHDRSRMSDETANSGLLGRWLDRLQGDRGHARWRGPCPACTWLDTTETALLETLLHSLPEPNFRTAFMAGSGLCLPHLHRAMELGAGDEVREILLARSQTTEEILIKQLGEIVRKHDYRFREEPPGLEVGAAERAIAHVVGQAGLEFPLRIGA